ncbi:MAG: hypothetical protein ACRYGR_03640 [Janthinobacterium lividum]
MTEEKIEYRDENGRLLDEAEVKALEGKVSFSTRYETRTRLVDSEGNQLHEGVVEESVAGTLAVGENPETGGAPEADASAAPPHVDVGADLAKEAVVENSQESAEPSSEPELGSATGKEEL